MKGIILAGGRGTRLYPLTKALNKHMLPIGMYPMIHYAIEKLTHSGIKQILIVTSGESISSMVHYFNQCEYKDLHIYYAVQTDPKGVAHALAVGEGFIEKEEKFVVMLADNLLQDVLSPYINDFVRTDQPAKVLIKKVENPHRYGVPEIRDNIIASIEEKPAQPKTNYCVTGIYMYDSSVFEVIRSIRMSGRGEFEITAVNNEYARQGKLTFDEIDGWWIDAGTFESLAEAAQLVGQHCDVQQQLNY